MYALKRALRVWVLLLALSLIVGTASVAQEKAKATYVGNKQCRLCHNKKGEGEQWNVWKAQKHSKAYTVLAGDDAKSFGEQRGLEKPPAESPECLRCHVTGYDPKKEKEEEKIPVKIVKENGVQCESCHGPGSLHKKDGMKFKTTKDASIDMSAHIVPADEKLCKTCHNEQSPTWNAEKYTLKDGTKAGFDFKQAWKIIAHANPTKKTAEEGSQPPQ